MKITKTVWLATDKDGKQCVFKDKPFRWRDSIWTGVWLSIGKKVFKQTWADKPKNIKMILEDSE